MILKISDIDFVFLSFDEPNADKNFADLKKKVPWAKRVHGVAGFDSAHKKAGEISETQRFITVDADTQIDEEFLSMLVDFNSLGIDDTYTLSWCGKIDLNGLLYGNGSLKCWTKEFVKEMKTHENHDGKNKNVSDPQNRPLAVLDVMAARKARVASPFLAMGNPSTIVAAAELAPGIPNSTPLNESPVVEDATTATQNITPR